jgi:DnaK suppressor protein
MAVPFVEAEAYNRYAGLTKINAISREFVSMDQTDIAGYRARLEALLHDLEAEEILGDEETRTVELDQQSVGRLSRMDALQRQAMAKATRTRRAGMIRRVRAALLRIEAGEFGYCSDCGEDIPQERLALDPTVPTCISCAR